MGLLNLLSPQAWKRAEAEKVVWDGGWPISSPRRTLKEFWLSEAISVTPFKTPLGGRVKKVTPCVDMAFHFERGRIVVEKAWVSQGPELNCSASNGEAFKAPKDFFLGNVLETMLQKEADTKKTCLRSRVFALMADEREAAGLEVPRSGARKK